MYDSNSFIQESIYESQTHNVIKITPPPPLNPVKQIRKEPIAPGKLSDNNFLKVYEQNQRLKIKQTELLKEMKQLKERVYKKDENARHVLEQELKTLAQGKKSNWDTVKAPFGKKSAPRGFSGNKNTSNNKLEHLLEIIDHYKQKLITAQEEITNLKRQKQILQQDSRLKDKKYEHLQEQKGEASNVQDEINLTQKFKRNIRELQLEKQRSKTLELAIRSLQAKLRSQEMKFQEFDNLKSQNRSLQQKIIRLTNLPDFHNIIDKAQEERKGKELESKLKLLNEKHNMLKDNSIKTQAELKLVQNKLIEVTSDLNSLEKENATLREQSVNDPIILKLMKKPQLVQKMIFQIQQEKMNEKTKNNLGFTDNKTQIEKLMLQKEELGRHVLNYQSKLKVMEETFKEREKISKIEKQQALISVNQPRGASSKQGVIYDGEVNVFTEQVSSLPAGTNYFDLFLGEVNLLETMVLSITGLTNPTSPLLLATVDFYNHNTEHSKLTQGCRCDLQSQFAFRIKEDDFFLKYLQKGSFQVDIWASEGNKNYHMGRGTIELKYLVTRARSRISPVISTSVPLYLNQKVMGSINLVMRLRLPIFDQLQKLKQAGNQAMEGSSQDAALRRLVIQIDEGRGFGDKSNTFVYYPFRLEDHYTRAAKGNSPNWNHIKLLEIAYDNDFKNYLRKNEIQFTVFDDNVLVMDEKNSDVVGNAFISLLPLLEGKPIKERLEIRKGNQRKGTIDIKIFWHESDGKQNDPQKLEETKRLSVDGVHDEIHSFMKEHSVDSEKIFRMIDWNKTGNISYDEFEEWVKKISARKFTKDTLNNYYKGFKQPLNLNNFVIRVSKEFAQEEKPNEQPIVAGINMINEFLKINSTQMKKKSIEDYLVGKNVVQLAKGLGPDNLGYISRAKLQEYFNKYDIECEIPNERVKLLDFLKKKQSSMNLTL